MNVSNNPFFKRTLVLAKTEEFKEKKLKVQKKLELNRKLLQNKTETWLVRHGKEQYIVLNKKKKDNLRECFLSIDSCGNKFIELNEILEAMLSLGIAESKVQAQLIFNEIDKDGSGHIDFDEFLLLLRNKNPRVKPLVELFTNIIDKKLGFDLDMMPFQLIVSNYRRKMIMNAVMEPGNPKAELILKSTSKVLSRKYKSSKNIEEKTFKTKNSLKNVINLAGQ